jgi:ribosomal protein S27E
MTCHYCGSELEDVPVPGHSIWQWVCGECGALFHEDSGGMSIISGPESEWEETT